MWFTDPFINQDRRLIGADIDLPKENLHTLYYL
jgi:hypothetical protein